MALAFRRLFAAPRFPKEEEEPPNRMDQQWFRPTRATPDPPPPKKGPKSQPPPPPLRLESLEEVVQEETALEEDPVIQVSEEQQPEKEFFVETKEHVVLNEKMSGVHAGTQADAAPTETAAVQTKNVAVELTTTTMQTEVEEGTGRQTQTMTVELTSASMQTKWEEGTERQTQTSPPPVQADIQIGFIPEPKEEMEGLHEEFLAWVVNGSQTDFGKAHSLLFRL